MNLQVVLFDLGFRFPFRSLINQKREPFFYFLGYSYLGFLEREKTLKRDTFFYARLLLFRVLEG